MALRCPTCGRFVSANYNCTNCGSNKKVPVVYKSSSSRSSTPSFSLPFERAVNDYFPSQVLPSFAPISIPEANPPTMHSQDLSSVLETVSTVKDQVNSLQRQYNEFKSNVQLLTTELGNLQNVKKVMEQKIKVLSEEQTTRMADLQSLKMSFENLKKLTGNLQNSNDVQLLTTELGNLKNVKKVMQQKIQVLSEEQTTRMGDLQSLKMSFENLQKLTQNLQHFNDGKFVDIGKNYVSLCKRYESIEQMLLNEKADRQKVEEKLKNLEKSKESTLELCGLLEDNMKKIKEEFNKNDAEYKNHFYSIEESVHDVRRILGEFELKILILESSKTAVLSECDSMGKQIRELKDDFSKICEKEFDAVNKKIYAIYDSHYVAIKQELRIEQTCRTKLEEKIIKLEKNKELFIVLEEKLKSEERIRQEMHLSTLRKLSELEACKNKFERQDRSRDMIIIILILIICWILYPSFVAKVQDTSLGYYVFNKNRQIGHL